MAEQIARPPGIQLAGKYRITQQFFIGSAGREKEIGGCGICGYKDCRCSFVIESTAPGHWHQCAICDQRFEHCKCLEPEMHWKVCPACNQKVRKSVAGSAVAS